MLRSRSGKRIIPGEVVLDSIYAKSRRPPKEEEDAYWDKVTERLISSLRNKNKQDRADFVAAQIYSHEEDLENVCSTVEIHEIDVTKQITETAVENRKRQERQRARKDKRKRYLDRKLEAQMRKVSLPEIPHRYRPTPKQMTYFYQLQQEMFGGEDEFPLLSCPRTTTESHVVTGAIMMLKNKEICTWEKLVDFLAKHQSLENYSEF